MKVCMEVKEAFQADLQLLIKNSWKMKFSWIYTEIAAIYAVASVQMPSYQLDTKYYWVALWDIEYWTINLSTRVGN